MLRVRKALEAWCSKNSTSRKELTPFHEILGFNISDLDKHCDRIEKVTPAEGPISLCRL